MARRHTPIGKRSVTAAILCLCACGRPLAPRIYDPGVVHEERGAFPVGELGPFGGAAGSEALAFHRGFARALEECNARGGAQGRRIELQVFDDRGRPADTRLGVERLGGPNGAVALVCTSGKECLDAARAAAGALPILDGWNGASGGDGEQRGYAAGRRLVAACESAKKILPKEVAAELAAAAARPYPRAP